jgi:hypothetical protein
LVVRSEFESDFAVALLSRICLRSEPEEGRRTRARLGQAALALALIAGTLLASRTVARGAHCEDAADQSTVAAAIAEIERSVDPCGESSEVREVLEQFRRCAHRGYRVCMDSRSERNFIERAAKPTDGAASTITWNPALRSELEWGCDGDPARAVRRDPFASLLHELVHAVQDCAGLEPAEHEFEAVRIENIYRRAGKLCQRTRYGDRPLPATMRIPCEPAACGCQPIDRTLTSLPVPAPPALMPRESSAGDTQP